MYVGMYYVCITKSLCLHLKPMQYWKSTILQLKNKIEALTLRIKGLYSYPRESEKSECGHEEGLRGVKVSPRFLVSLRGHGLVREPFPLPYSLPQRSIKHKQQRELNQMDS